MTNKSKNTTGNSLPDRYSDSLHFLEHMFGATLTSCWDNSNVKETTEKPKVTEIQIKQPKNPLSKLRNIKNPISRTSIIIFIISLIVLTAIFSIIFVYVFDNDSNNTTDTYSVANQVYTYTTFCDINSKQ